MLARCIHTHAQVSPILAIIEKSQCMSVNTAGEHCLRLLHCENSFRVQVLWEQAWTGAEVMLALSVSDKTLRFSYAQTQEESMTLCPVELDATRFSDEFVEGWGFTGVFAGIACQDGSGQRRFADFAFFDYRET